MVSSARDSDGDTGYGTSGQYTSSGSTITLTNSNVAYAGQTTVVLGITSLGFNLANG
jgi:hypothetical protein